MILMIDQFLIFSLLQNDDLLCSKFAMLVFLCKLKLKHIFSIYHMEHSGKE